MGGEEAWLTKVAELDGLRDETRVGDQDNQGSHGEAAQGGVQIERIGGEHRMTMSMI